MTDNLVHRLRYVFEDTGEVLDWIDTSTYVGSETHDHVSGMHAAMLAAADRIEMLEGALCQIWVLNNRRNRFRDDINTVLFAVLDEGEKDG
jgi:hypothetical protein